jgi:hypothetical protein
MAGVARARSQTVALHSLLYILFTSSHQSHSSSLHTGVTNIFGTSVSETTMRPSPTMYRRGGRRRALPPLPRQRRPQPRPGLPPLAPPGSEQVRCLTPPCIFHWWFSVQNLQGGVRVTSTSPRLLDLLHSHCAARRPGNPQGWPSGPQVGPVVRLETNASL